MLLLTLCWRSCFLLPVHWWARGDRNKPASTFIQVWHDVGRTGRGRGERNVGRNYEWMVSIQNLLALFHSFSRNWLGIVPLDFSCSLGSGRVPLHLGLSVVNSFPETAAGTTAGVCFDLLLSRHHRGDRTVHWIRQLLKWASLYDWESKEAKNASRYRDTRIGDRTWKIRNPRVF